MNIYGIIILGDLMKREDIKTLLVIAIFIILIILAVKFLIAILPIVIVALIGLLIYDSIKKKSNKSKKDDGVKEAKILREKNID